MDHAAMVSIWEGDVGRHWAAEGDRYERMDDGFGPPLFAAAALRAGERVLDVGCGFGARTFDAGERVGPGSVLGVDISTPMLAVARARAERDRARNVEFRHVDAQVDDLDGPFDVVISQFAVMFFTDHVAGFQNLRAALRPGGRMAFLCWRDLSDQERIMVPTMAALAHVPVPDMTVETWAAAAFSLAELTVIDDVLTRSGFAEVGIVEVTVPTCQGADVDDTVDHLTRSEFGDLLFAGAEPTAVVAAQGAIAEALAPHQRYDGIYLDGSAWLVTATV